MNYENKNSQLQGFLNNGRVKNTIAVDEELSLVSKNPVQNKVITQALANIPVPKSPNLITQITLNESTNNLTIQNIEKWGKIYIRAEIKNKNFDMEGINLVLYETNLNVDQQLIKITDDFLYNPTFIFNFIVEIMPDNYRISELTIGYTSTEVAHFYKTLGRFEKINFNTNYLKDIKISLISEFDIGTKVEVWGLE